MVRRQWFQVIVWTFALACSAAWFTEGRGEDPKEVRPLARQAEPGGLGHAAGAFPTSHPLPWDTMEDAYVIPSLPFTHDYSNVGYSPNYGECCPYCYGPTPDVIYRFDPVDSTSVEVRLCNDGTDYDTVVYMYRNGPAGFVACNDDACTSPDFPYPYVSRIASVRMEPGNAYYIVVGGYCSQTGNYRLTVTERDTHHLVRADDTGDFATIQDALDGSYDGDVIELEDGTYTGPGNRALVIGTKRVTLRSLGGDPSLCILDCEEAARGLVFTSWEPPGTLIEGITIRSGSAPDGLGGGAWFGYEGATSCTFRNCVFESCRARLGAGVATEGSELRLERCRFRQNWASESGGAVYARQIITLDAVECTFDGNKAAVRGGAIYTADGVYLTTISSCTLTDNRVTGPSGLGGAISSDSYYPEIRLENTIVAFNHAAATGGIFAPGVVSSCCDYYGNSNGDWGGCPSQIGQDGNISLDPRFCDFAGEDYRLQTDSPCAPHSPQNPECALVGAWPVACASTGADEGGADSSAPGAFVRLWPNPAQDGCDLALSLRLAGPATIQVFDPAGRRVRTLPVPTAGEGPVLVHWDERDDAGREVPSGSYLVSVRTAAGLRSVRVTVLR
jgi:predicted outer membrane repeat protein